MSESDNKSISTSEENDHDFHSLQNEFNFEASKFKPISTMSKLPTLSSPNQQFKDIFNGTISPPPPPGPHPHPMVFPSPFFPGPHHMGPNFSPFFSPLTRKLLNSPPVGGKMPPSLPFVPPILSSDGKSSPLSKKSDSSPTNCALKRALFIPGVLGSSPGPGPSPPMSMPQLPGLPGGPAGLGPTLSLGPIPPGFPMPPAFWHPLLPFPLAGRDMKHIGKKWGRTKRKKGKVVIDKDTGRKLITAITCVACFKAKKKCVYANGSSKRCNYCSNRRIDCIKRLDRRCQKIWHESGRQARFKTSDTSESAHIQKKRRLEYTPVEKDDQSKETLSEDSEMPELPSPQEPLKKLNIKSESPSNSKYYRNLLNPEPVGSDLLSH